MATQILKTHDLVFPDRLPTKAAKIIFCGGNDIALAPYGERWRQLRKFCVLELLSAKRVQSFASIRKEEVDKIIESITRSSRERDTINLTEILSTMSNAIIFRCSLGNKFDKDYTDKLVGLIKKATMLIEYSLSFGDFFPWLKWMDSVTGLNGRLRRTSQELDILFNQVIDDHLLDNSKVDDKDDKRNFIDILLLHAGTDNLSLTRDNMKGIIMVSSLYLYS
ncbi:hypothetical protein MKW92_034500 [Papaver armeniacum]|nr:hypothetical protein MKW92_034500 [Papaver armeniacum]